MRLSSIRWLIISSALAIIPGLSSSAAAQSRSLYMPVLQAGVMDARLSIVNTGTTPATVTLIGRGYDGKLFGGSVANPVTVTVPPLNSKTIRPKDLFGASVPAGWIELQT